MTAAPRGRWAGMLAALALTPLVLVPYFMPKDDARLGILVLPGMDLATTVARAAVPGARFVSIGDRLIVLDIEPGLGPRLRERGVRTLINADAATCLLPGPPSWRTGPSV